MAEGLLLFSDSVTLNSVTSVWKKGSYVKPHLGRTEYKQLLKSVSALKNLIQTWMIQFNPVKLKQNKIENQTLVSEIHIQLCDNNLWRWDLRSILKG